MPDAQSGLQLGSLEPGQVGAVPNVPLHLPAVLPQPNGLQPGAEGVHVPVGEPLVLPRCQRPRPAQAAAGGGPQASSLEGPTLPSLGLEATRVAPSDLAEYLPEAASAPP